MYVLSQPCSRMAECSGGMGWRWLVPWSAMAFRGRAFKSWWWVGVPQMRLWEAPSLTGFLLVDVISLNYDRDINYQVLHREAIVDTIPSVSRTHAPFYLHKMSVFWISCYSNGKLFHLKK